MRYAPIEKGQSNAGDVIFNNATAHAREFILAENDTYVPTWMLVAQWENVHPFPHGADSTEGLDQLYLDQVGCCYSM